LCMRTTRGIERHMADTKRATKRGDKRKDRENHSIRFSDAEWRELEEAADRDGMASASAYVRAKALQAARAQPR